MAEYKYDDKNIYIFSPLLTRLCGQEHKTFIRGNEERIKMKTKEMNLTNEERGRNEEKNRENDVRKINKINRNTRPFTKTLLK